MIRRWLSSRPPIEVTVFTRAGCHLCDVAIELLKTRARRHKLRISTVDITDDPTLLEQFGETIPVVRIEDRDRFFGVVDPVLLDRLLNSLPR